jgi:hypothetical protein
MKLLILTSCSDTDRTNKNESENSKNSVIKPDTSLNSDLKIPNKFSGKPINENFSFIGDSVELPDFEIEIILSENAEKKLKIGNESVIVKAYFSGIPKDTTLEEYIEFGAISIGSFQIEIFDKRVVRFEKVKISKSKYEKLEDKNFEVLINVFSGRRSSMYNLLESDILQAGINSIKGKRHILKGKLIYGD